MEYRCKNCNRIFEYHRKREHCSNECFSIWRKRPENKKIKQEKFKKTCMEKYGVDNSSKNELVKESAKQTCLKKYGCVSPTQNSEIRKKQIDTCIEKYGVDNPFKNKKIQSKHRKTLLKNYNVNVPLKSEIIREKQKQTCLKKYGTEFSSSNIDVKETRRSTCIKRYGVNSVFENLLIKEKIKKSCKIFNYNQLNNRLITNNIKCLFSLEEYTKSEYHIKYPFKCIVCNTEFMDRCSHGRIPRCLKCYPIQNNSLMEHELQKFLMDSSYTIIKNDREILNGKELDIYIPSKNIAIELDGLYWHSELSGKKNKFYHLNKTKACESKGIKLIHIFEDEWLNKQDIVKSKLLHVLNHDKNKIYARKCIIKEIQSNISVEFLNKYHIQGSDKSSIRLGAFYNNELVAVMTFGKLRLALGNRITKIDEYEMYRFCTNKNVIGIGGKLLSHFIKNYNPIKIISYADRRYSNIDATFYTKLGFSLIKETTPNYWYMRNYRQREYRFNYIKHSLKNKLNLYDPLLTEWENMQINGYDRIWDCGNLKYELIIKK